MSRCPAGHDSATTDYCDVCGAPMAQGDAPAEQAAAPASTTGGACPKCGAAREGRFCEVCGHDSALPGADGGDGSEADSPGTRWLAPGTGRPSLAEEAVVAPVVAGNWTAVVCADHDWFEEVRRRNGPDAGALQFPPYCPERRFVLTGPKLAIGRRSRSRGIEPEIDLTGPPLDPGISTLHALLLARPDGRWELVDLDSTNGTTVGDSARPIAPNTPILLADGDRIKLGAWTTLTIFAPA